MALEAWRLATRLMTPVVILSDAYVANGAEPWRIPDTSALAPITLPAAKEPAPGEAFKPYVRDEYLSRPWALPGTPALMHRIGGLEKENITGNISYDPANHEHMVRLRALKVANAAQLIPPQAVSGPATGALLILSWGGTYGTCADAWRTLHRRGMDLAHAHLRHLNPFPANLGDILKSYDRVLIPELNTGQLRQLIRARWLVDAIGLNKIKGRPFTTADVVQHIEELMA